MRTCQGYDLTATTNGARFQAEVLIHLVREVKRSTPEVRSLSVGHVEWFQAFLTATGLAADDAPTYAQLSHRHGQRIEIAYGTGDVIRRVKEGATPELAMNVVIWWPQTEAGPNRYSYQDTLSTPNLQVTNNRVIVYRLLDLGDQIVYDQVEGITGRPTSGLMGLLFRLMGDGRMVQSRMAISQDGIQVSRGRAEKAIWGVTSTVTVYPDGRMIEDTPVDRPDLRALEARLRQPLSVEYAPIRLPE
jgi:hypothetical protein